MTAIGPNPPEKVRGRARRLCPGTSDFDFLGDLNCVVDPDVSVVFRLAVRDGLLDVNPCARGEMLYCGTRVDTIWSSPQIGAFLALYKFAYMDMPLRIGLGTGQREGDVLRLKWSQYDGQTLKLNQRKGRRRGKQGQASTVVIPVAETFEGSTRRGTRRAQGGEGVAAQDREPDPSA
jgi:hypothetical protein